jgi:hypothetical protein
MSQGDLMTGGSCFKFKMCRQIYYLPPKNFINKHNPEKDLHE